MKQHATHSLTAQPHRRLRLTSLATAALALCSTAIAFDPNVTCPSFTNAASRFPVIIDGRFTPNGGGGIGFAPAAVIGGGQIDEWSDIVPQVFTGDASGTLFRTCAGDPAATSYVYTSLDDGIDALYLMYDFVGDKNDPSAFFPGDTIAQVKFGVHLPASNGDGGFNLGGNPPDQNTPIVVRFVAGRILNETARASAAVIIGGGSVDVVFDVDLPGGATNVPGFVIGLEGAVSFGSSPNSADNHLQAELGVGLRIPANFGTAFPGNGINPATGLYDPAPKFWGSGFNDPTGSIGRAARAAAVTAVAAPITFHGASANLVTVFGDGSVRVNSGADAGAGFVPFSTVNARKMGLDKLKALRAAATNRDIQRRLDDIIRDQTAASYSSFYLDQARLTPRGGRFVFEIDEDTLEDIASLIRRVTGTPLAADLQKCADLILALDGEFARVAVNDAAAAGLLLPAVITEAKRDIAAGDRAALANRSWVAQDSFEDAWADVSIPRRGRD